MNETKPGLYLPIMYTSRLLHQAEQNYSTIKKGMLAIICSINYFRPYLYGAQFSLVTDRRPFAWAGPAQSAFTGTRPHVLRGHAINENYPIKKH